MIKLIASDLDGTLFYPKRRLTLLTRKNTKFLQDFHSAGGKVCLVTGRERRMSMKVQKKLGFDVSVCGCNGAFIYEHGKFVKSHPIPKEDLIDVYMYIKNNYGVIGFLVFDEGDEIKIAVANKASIVPYLGIFINLFNGKYAEKYIVSEKDVIHNIVKGGVFKLMPIFGISKSACIRSLQAGIALKQKYKDRLTVVDAKVSLEITAHGVSKSNALEEYISDLGISKDEVAVVGDSYNDLSLFENFENSFGMANGEGVILNKASHIVSSVSDLRGYVLDENNHLKE